MKNFLKVLSLIVLFVGVSLNSHSAEKVEYLKTDWSFKGLFGKFDRGSLQRGYQVYTEVCSSCHSMKYLSYRNLSEKGGPEFTEPQVKARGDCVDYIYSLLQGYEDPPAGVTLDDGVYYNKYMYGNKIKMSNQLSDGLVEYSDGTNASVEQMAKDVTTFLMWTAEPHLETRHKMGFKAIVYLIILTVLVYFSMKRIWSRIETKV